MRTLFWVFIFLVLLFGVSFACLNASLVSVDLYIARLKTPLSLLLMIDLLLGVLLGSFVTLSVYLKMMKQNRQLKRQLTFAEKEITNIRSIPIVDPH